MSIPPIKTSCVRALLRSTESNLMRRICGTDAALRATGTTSSRLMGPNGLQPNVAPGAFVLGRPRVRRCARLNQGTLDSRPAQRWAGGLNLVEVVLPPLGKLSLDRNRYQIPNSEEMSEPAFSLNSQST